MEIHYAEFLSASNIYNEVIKEIQKTKSIDELPRRNLYNKILKNCNRIIVERFSDYNKQEEIRDCIEKILLPIFKNQQN